MGGVHRPSALDSTVLRQDGPLVRTDHDGQAITFSQEHTSQQKVRMITRGALCDLPTPQLANRCGCKTRTSSDEIRHAVLHGAPADLMPQRTGPHTPPKRTKEVEARIIRRRFATEAHMDDIADAFTPLGVDVSARLVGQGLAAAGLSQKNGCPQHRSPRGPSPRRRPQSSITRARRAHASSPVPTSSRT